MCNQFSKVLEISLLSYFIPAPKTACNRPGFRAVKNYERIEKGEESSVVICLQTSQNLFTPNFCSMLDMFICQSKIPLLLQSLLLGTCHFVSSFMFLLCSLLSQFSFSPSSSALVALCYLPHSACLHDLFLHQLKLSPSTFPINVLKEQ